MPLSQKFKDDSIEEQFKANMQKEIILFSKFWMIEFILFQIVVCAFKIGRFYFVKEFHLEWTLGLQGGIITLAIADYLLSKRFLVLALHFSNV